MDQPGEFLPEALERIYFLPSSSFQSLPVVTSSIFRQQPSAFKSLSVSFCSHCHTASCLLLIRTLVITLGSSGESSYLKILKLIRSVKSLLPHKGTSSKIIGIGAQMSLGALCSLPHSHSPLSVHRAMMRWTPLPDACLANHHILLPISDCLGWAIA